MGGKILEFKGEWLYRKAVREGLEQGEKRGKLLDLVDLVKEGALPENFALKRAEEKYGVSAEKFRELLAAGSEDERLQG